VGQDLSGLGPVERGGAPAAVVVDGAVEGLAVDLPDQVLGLLQAGLDQGGQVVALVLAEPVDAVLTLRGNARAGRAGRGGAVAGRLRQSIFFEREQQYAGGYGSEGWGSSPSERARSQAPTPLGRAFLLTDLLTPAISQPRWRGRR
jgi:hypothetical protein